MKEIGIPNVYGVDQIHGTTYSMGGTLFPQGVNMAATLNPELMRKVRRSTPTRAAPVTFPGSMAL